MRNLSGWSRLFIVMNAIWAVIATTFAVILLVNKGEDLIETLIAYILSFVVPISLWALI